MIHMCIVEKIGTRTPRLVEDDTTVQEKKKDTDRETSVVLVGRRRVRSQNGRSMVVVKRFS